MTKQFYTSVVTYGNRLLVRSIRDGLHQKEKISFTPTLYTTNKKTTQVDTKWSTLYGVPAYEIQPGSITDCKDFIKTYENIDSFNICGQTNYGLQYIANEYPSDIIFDSEHIKIVGIDIETGVAESGEFPHPKYADQEILLITLRDLKTAKTVIFGARPYSGEHSDIYVQCKDEQDLLRKFITYWQCDVPDIITGWNIDLFDIPYIVNRIQKVLGDDYKKLSPWNIVNERNIKVRGNEEQAFDIVGIASLDYLPLYKKYIPKNQESFKLDHIAFVELGEQKLDHSMYATFREFYSTNFDLFTDYNYTDVLLINKLEDKLKLIELHLTLSYMAKTNYGDALSPVKLWDAIIYNDLLKKNIVIPNKNVEKKSAKFEGAYVKDPIPGLHKWVASFDLASLYPHIIMGSNISPETLTDTRLNITVDSLLKKEPLPETEYAVTANGWCYSKDKQGFLAELMESLYSGRASNKREMIKLEQEYEADKSKKYLIKEISRLNNLQMAQKTAANSGYGALGSVYFRYYDLRLAESITTTGQLAVRWIANKINVYMNSAMNTNNVDYIIASDTDSVYVTLESLVESTQKDKTTEELIQFMDLFCSKVLAPYIERSYQELADYLGSYQQKMSMKREVLADRGLWGNVKKRYVLRVYNSEGVQYAKPKLKIMGLEMVKSSTPMAIRDSLKSTIDVIMDGSNQDLIKFVQTIREDFNKLSIEDIAFPRGITDIKKYSSKTEIYSKGCPMHVRAALLYNNYIKEYKLTYKYQPIKSGDKIKFIYLKKPNTIKENIIGFPAELPPEFNLHKYIDFELQFKKVFLDALDNIIVPIGWSLEERNSLEDFFV